MCISHSICTHPILYTYASHLIPYIYHTIYILSYIAYIHIYIYTTISKVYSMYNIYV